MVSYAHSGPSATVEGLPMISERLSTEAQPLPPEPRCTVRGMNLRRRLPILAAAVMLVIAVGCSKPAAPAQPAAPAKPAASAQPSSEVYYANCAAAKAAGAAPLRRGQPGYRAALDRDNDGIACE